MIYLIMQWLFLLLFLRYDLLRQPILQPTLPPPPLHFHSNYGM